MISMPATFMPATGVFRLALVCEGFDITSPRGSRRWLLLFGQSATPRQLGCQNSRWVRLQDWGSSKPRFDDWSLVQTDATALRVAVLSLLLEFWLGRSHGRVAAGRPTLGRKS